MAADVPAKVLTPSQRVRSELAVAAINHLVNKRQQLHHKVGQLREASKSLPALEEKLAATEELLRLHGYVDPDETSRKVHEAAQAAKAQAAAAADAGGGASDSGALEEGAAIAARVEKHYGGRTTVAAPDTSMAQERSAPDDFVEVDAVTGQPIERPVGS